MLFRNPCLGQGKNSSTVHGQRRVKRGKTKKTHRVYAGDIQPSVRQCSPLDKLYTSTLHLPHEDIQDLVWRVEEMFSYGVFERRHKRTAKPIRNFVMSPTSIPITSAQECLLNAVQMLSQHLQKLGIDHAYCISEGLLCLRLAVRDIH